MATLNETFDMLPPAARQEVADFIEFLAQKYLKKKVKINNNREKIMKFSGAWKDMPDEEFQDFMNDISARRKNSFKKRREI